MLHSIITIAVCGVVLWVVSTAVILAFAYAASPRRRVAAHRAQPVTTESAKDRTDAR